MSSSDRLEPRELDDELAKIQECIRALHVRHLPGVPLRPERAPQQLQELLQLQQLRRQASPARKAEQSSSANSCWQWIAFLTAGAALPVCFTIPYYVCANYRDWYIDEMFAIVRNPDVWSGPWRNLVVHDFWGQQLWSENGTWTHKSFRPLTSLTFRLQLEHQDRQFANPGSLRGANCCIHSMNVILLQLLLHSQRVDSRWGFLAASLFALHPVHLENIPYLVGRADSMATSFMLCGLLFRARMPVASLLALPLFALAAGLCKETGLVLPAVSAVQVLASEHAPAYTVAIMDIACFVALAVARWAYVGGTDVGFSFVDTPIQYAESVVVRSLSYLMQHARYAQLLVLPWYQSWDYSYDALPLVQGFGDLRLLGILASYGSVAGFTAMVARSEKSLRSSGALALALTLLPFVPCSNLFFIVGTTVAERLLYPCTAGWALGIAVLGTGIEKSKRKLAIWLLRCFACLFLVLYAYRSAVRTQQWSSQVTLFSADMQSWHRSAKVTHTYASLLHGAGQLQGAIAFYNRSLQIFDDNAVTDYAIAQCLIRLGRYAEAATRFDKIMSGHFIGFHAGNLPALNLDRGWLLAKVGRHKDAVPVLEQGLQEQPNAVYAWNALAVSQAKVGNLQGALDCLLRAIELSPRHAIVWSNAAAAAAAGGDLEQARAAARNALALDPEDSDVVHNARILAGEADTKLGYALPGEQPTLKLFFEA